jgi:predicted TIM-barrel fold metal-dependent hydrolase
MYNSLTKLAQVVVLGLTGIALAAIVGTQQRRGQNRQTPPMDITEYTPRNTLVTTQHPKARAKYPFIDIHSHHGRIYTSDELAKLLKEMDSINLRVINNLSGGFGDQLAAHVKNLQGGYPDRFTVFANLDFSDINEPGYGHRQALRLEQDVKNGASGLKIFKNLGLDLKYRDGRRVPTGSPDFDEVWEMCGKLNIPVLIHTGEPAPFFDPIDKFNERWLELQLFPSRARPNDRYPKFEEVMAEQERMFAKHPKTKFIAAHLAWRGNNLAKLGEMFDRLPNMYVDIAAVIAELGRQPFTAHDFIIKYQDRILFGKDIYDVTEYPTYFQLLETHDEFFDYFRHYHAWWQLYGSDLPDEVLKKVYYKNALKLLPRLKASDFPK